jgi:hypothetical protein
MNRLLALLLTLLALSGGAPTQRGMATLKPPRTRNALRTLLAPPSWAELVAPLPPPPPPPDGSFL